MQCTKLGNSITLNSADVSFTHSLIYFILLVYRSQPGKHNYTVVQFSILYSINNPVSLYYSNSHKLEQFTEVSQTIHTFCHPIIISRTSLGFVAWVIAIHNCSLLRTSTHCLIYWTHSFRHAQESHMILCIQIVITFFLLVPLPRIVASYSTLEPRYNFRNSSREICKESIYGPSFKTFLAFYRIRRAIAVFTTARRWSL